MPSSPRQRRHKPLFNRRYLLLLVWILPALILLLHQTGRSSETELRHDATRTLYGLASQAHANAAPVQLHLLLPQGPLLSDADWLAGQLRRQQLNTWLHAAPLQTWLAQQGWQLRSAFEPQAGYLRLRMSGETVTAAQLQALAAQLPPVLPAVAHPAEASARLRAQRYLELQDAEPLLLRALGDALQVGADPASRDRVDTGLRWVILAPPEQLEALQLSAAPAPPPAGRAVISAADLSGPRQLEANRHAQDWQLIAQSLPPPTDGASLARQRLQAELMAELLPQALPEGTEFRWRWQPLLSQGYSALLLRNAAPALAQSPGPALAPLLTEAQLSRVVTRLLRQLEQRLNETPAAWAELLALYQLPLDTAQAFRATLQQIDLAAARALLETALIPTASLHLSFHHPVSSSLDSQHHESP